MRLTLLSAFCGGGRLTPPPNAFYLGEAGGGRLEGGCREAGSPLQGENSYVQQPVLVWHQNVRGLVQVQSLLPKLVL